MIGLGVNKQKAVVENPVLFENLKNRKEPE